MRIMSLDFGSKTVGVAVTDPLGITAQGITIIRRDSEKRLRKTYAAIEKLIEEYDVEMIVVGLPLNMDGSEGDRAKKSKAFAEDLRRRTHLPVEMFDERLTTVDAYEIMADAGVKKEDYKEHVDKVAAMVILEDFMKNK